MKVYYWSPHTSHVATIKAVYNSALSLLRYGKHHVTIVNANGEWDNYNLANINIVNLSKKIYFRTFPRIGYLNSRLAYFYIFIKCFFPLKNLIKKEKPDFLIIHLITLLPLILLIFFKFETKVILRISGLPRSKNRCQVLEYAGREAVKRPWTRDGRISVRCTQTVFEVMSGTLMICFLFEQM
jgi:hypothetical protein